MKPRRVKTAPGFDKALRELPPNLREQTIEAVKRFIDRTGERSLQPERKKGLQGIWAFRVTSGVRVFYVQKKDAEGAYSELFHVGPHDDCRTVSRKSP
jgi:mRNA-degrading endonuclease RelE of RelBE toxin-antitoxin system